MTENIKNILFTPATKNIKQVLGNSESFYIVPDYQRPYDWGDENVENLFDDIYEAFKDAQFEEYNLANYFLGSIILIQRDNMLEVVDGQQRLTTLTILFCVLRDFYLQNNKEIINNIKSLVNDEYRLRFITQLHNQNNFQQEILQQIKIPTPLPSIEERKKNKFINTVLIFKNKLDELMKVSDIEEIKKFADFINNNVNMITITCNDKSYAIKLFQTLNDRGLNLSNSDLLKSYLYGECKTEMDRRTFINDWNNIENIAKDIDEKLEDLLTYYEYYLLASNPKKQLYEELVKKVKGNKPVDIVYDIKTFITCFKEIDDDDSELIYSFYYLLNQVFWKSILTTAKKANYSNFNLLCRELRKMFYLYWIAGYTSSKVKHLTFNIIDWIESNKDIEFITKKIEEKINDDNVIELALKNIKGNAYEESWLKPLLILIEYSRTDGTKPAFIETNNKLHVDHILPIKWDSIDEWKKLGWDNTSANQWLNKIGNLTLLSYKKNIAQKNDPPLLKHKIYKTGYGGKTAFEISKDIIEDLEKGYWRKEEVEKRQGRIIGEIIKLFGIEIEI